MLNLTKPQPAWQLDGTEDLPKIDELWLADMAKQAKLQPQNNLRSYNMGYECDRFHFYSIRNWQDRELPDPILQSIFNEGHRHEVAIIQKLQDLGFEITDTQRAYQIDDPLITGHVDGLLRYKGVVYPFDAKSMDSNIFDKVWSISDLLNSKSAYRRSYVVQMQLYLHMTEQKIGAIILKNKSNGQFRTLWMRYDADFVSAVIERARRVYADLAKNEAGTRSDDLSLCQKCAFKHICLPDIQADPTKKIKFIEKQEFAQTLDRIDQLKVVTEEVDALEEEINAMRDILGVGDYICGDWLFSVKPFKRAGSEKQYLKKSYVRLKIHKEQ